VSEPEVERVARETLEAWNADTWDRFEELWNPDAEIVTPPEWPEPGTFRGLPAVRAEFERLKETWDTDRVELLSIESRDDRALAHIRWSGTGQSSGFPFDLEVWWAGTVRDGRNQRVEYFMDEESARRRFEAH
jgi:ketosteroid isomerase-like protein